MIPSSFTTPEAWTNFINTLPETEIMGHRAVIVKLNEQNLTDENIVALAEVLKDNNRIWRLDLSDNLIGDVGAKALATALKTNTFLCANAFTDTGSLDLENNHIGFDGLKALVEVYRDTDRAVHTLSIHINPALHDPESEENKQKMSEIEKIVEPLRQKTMEMRKQLYPSGDCVIC